MTSPVTSDVTLSDLEELLDQIDDGKIGLPDFQREFVWTTSQVRALLGTVFNGWPCGSILITEENNLGFKLRSVEGAPPLRTPKTVLLDGQQRLTALYSSLRNAGETVYVIDFSNFEPDSATEFSVEENIRSVARDDWEPIAASPLLQATRFLLPVTALRSAAAFFEWRDQALDDAESSLPGRVDRNLLTELYKSKLAMIHRYRIPAVILGARLDIVAVSRIFEKVNRTGLRLTTFDLMVARAYDRQWNLRDEWETARLTYPRLDEFLHGDGMPILQAISLRNSGSVRQNDVLELKGEVRRDWTAAVEATIGAIDFLVERCGLSSRTWIPYDAQLILLAAFGMDWQLRDYARQLEAWFYASSFAQQFDVAANTRIVSQYRRFLDDDYSSPPVVLDNILYGSRRSQRAIWAGFLCLIASDSLGDMYGRFESADRDDMVRNIELRRLLPTPLLSSANSFASWATPPHLLVGGIGLCDRPGSAQIKRLGLTAATERAVADVGERAADAHLEAQLLPDAARLIEIGESPEAFLAARRELLQERLQRIGIQIDAARAAL